MQHQNNRVTALSPPLRRNSRLQFGALPTRRFLGNIWCGSTIDGSIIFSGKLHYPLPLHPPLPVPRSLMGASHLGEFGAISSLQPPTSEPLIVGSPHSKILGEAASLSELA